MILTYKELINYLGSDYQIKKQIKEGLIAKVSPGFYAVDNYSPFELIVKKYNNSVFTFLSALYFLKLFNRQPDFYYLASKKESTRIDNPLIKQTFVDSKTFFDNVILLTFDGVEIQVYSKEKSLIIFLKNRNKVSSDIYHEVIVNYRNIAKTLNLKQISLLLNKEKNKERLKEIINREIL